MLESGESRNCYSLGDVAVSLRYYLTVELNESASYCCSLETSKRLPARSRFLCGETLWVNTFKENPADPTGDLALEKGAGAQQGEAHPPCTAPSLQGSLGAAPPLPAVTRQQVPEVGRRIRSQRCQILEDGGGRRL